jgi:small subunit ribosomal protein S20
VTPIILIFFEGNPYKTAPRKEREKWYQSIRKLGIIFLIFSFIFSILAHFPPKESKLLKKFSIFANILLRMAITKAAKKSLRQSKKRRKINIRRWTKLRTLLKEAKLLISQEKMEEAKKLLPRIYEILDKSAKVGLIKKNTASRRKSRISKSINRNKK